jgi:hypothetical protein
MHPYRLLYLCYICDIDSDASTSLLVPTIVIITDLFMDVNYRFPSNLFVNLVFLQFYLDVNSLINLQIMKRSPITKYSVKYAQ